MEIEKVADMSILKLCYIENNKAYFTTQKLSQQWGTNWDEIDYQHNAGEPYKPILYKHFNEDGTPKWIIEKVFFYGTFKRAGTDLWDNPYSVEMINKGRVPWLTPYKEQGIPPIMAGITLEEFIKFIKILCPRCMQETNNDFGEDCNLYVEVMGNTESLRFMCNDCAIWAWNRLEGLLKKSGE
jgi:hypothetical protein